ncbi:TIGR04338 family metallohydrolase [Gordonia sp. (in: high G+C Gram-positive bacteria)]|uniref:TIGR04338 family metallohydrolase n=1 Tax=Gordonia sp. (in: high G+C Gram-positive bacteria) TaxID=84139 RepID=UPI0039E43439
MSPKDDAAPARRAVDGQRSAVYAAEQMVFGLFDNVGSGRAARVGGANLTLPHEARFASLESIDDYVVKVLALPAVVERFGRAGVPVRVRSRRGAAAATYEPGPEGGVIAIPAANPGGGWALRELVVLHELAHHLDDSGGPAHGPGFRTTLADLAGLVLGPEVSFCYRVIFGESGLTDARPT